MSRLLFSTGILIYNYLLEHGDAYILEIYRAFKKEKGKWISWRDQPLKVGSYQNFRNYIFWLQRLGLIEFIRKEPSSTPDLQPRRYYKLSSQGREKRGLFFDPRRKLYPKSWKKSHCSVRVKS